MQIGFITCAGEKLVDYFPTLAEPQFVSSELPFTPDDQIAVNELRKYGFEVKAVVWNSPIDSLEKFDLLIVRSPWDYADSDEAKSQFMQWIGDLEKAGLRVANPAAFMQWLLDKHYLNHLHQEGIPVIPTKYLEKGSYLDLHECFKKQGEFVLKPCVSAAGKGLYHIKTIDDAMKYQSEINNRMQASSYMLQDFIPEITSNGEWSLIFLGGKYSHALHKKPGPNSILVHAERGGSLSFDCEPNQSLINFANAIYPKIFSAFSKVTQAVCNSQLVLYLRLDIIESKAGPLMIECEGVEPELFFRAEPKSQHVFCQAIAEFLKS